MTEQEEAWCRARIAELEQRVLDGTDDFEYCLRWIGIHHRLIEATRSRP